MSTVPPQSVSNQNVWYYIIGAGFIGFWLGMMLFGQVEAGWFIWGLFGLAIAAGAYVGRLTSEAVRIAIWIVVGLALGILTVAAVVAEDPLFVATFITGVGAGLIAAGLPRPGTAWVPEQHHASHAYAPADPPGHGQQDPYAQHGHGQQGQQQWQPGQQQQQRYVYGEEYR